LKGALAPFHQKEKLFQSNFFVIAKRGRRKGGARYKTVKLSLPKRLYSV